MPQEKKNYSLYIRGKWIVVSVTDNQLACLPELIEVVKSFLSHKKLEQGTYDYLYNQAEKLIKLIGE